MSSVYENMHICMYAARISSLYVRRLFMSGSIDLCTCACSLRVHVYDYLLMTTFHH